LLQNHQLHLRLRSDGHSSHNQIRLKLSRIGALPAGGYTIHMTKRDVVIAGDSDGLFHGIQTLIQILPVRKTAVLEIPLVEVRDYPRFQWRGMHLDVARHFFPVHFIKQYIDLLALYKMNVFHWHLTDDQGWRIEIKHYPKLTEVGAYRSGSMVGPYSAQKFDSVRYGGFYTQDDIREVVAYAGSRHVTIVPEIEMPGHCMAALASYPELSTARRNRRSNSWTRFSQKSATSFRGTIFISVVMKFRRSGGRCALSVRAQCEGNI
jgi:hexosaminidase